MSIALAKPKKELAAVKAKQKEEAAGIKKRKASSIAMFKDKSTLEFDLLYQLSYMSVIASSGVPRKQIFQSSATLTCSSAEYFRKIELTTERLKYDYAKACRLIGESAKEDKIKELLLRFSSSLLSGEPEAEFLVREAEKQTQDYENDYGRKIEALKLWTDGYVSLILSAILVIIMGIVSTMIWKVDNAFIFSLVFISAAATGFGVYIIYLSSPREKMVLRDAGSPEQRAATNLFKWLVLAAGVLSSFVVLLGYNLGWALIIIGICVFPIGWLSVKDDQQVIKRDSEVGTFLASLGGVCAAIGTTVKDALGRIDLNSITHLRKEVKSLYTRLTSGIIPALAWKRFIHETGSELSNRSIGMFYDAINLGGEPEQAGYNASLFANRIAQLRAHRKAVAMPFRMLCITMHAAVVALLVFVTEVIGIFGMMVGEAESNMPAISGAPAMSSFTSFNIQGLEMLSSLVIPLVIIFTIANSLAPAIADGGSWYKILYNLGIMSIISGACLVLLPGIAGMLFSSIKI